MYICLPRTTKGKVGQVIRTGRQQLVLQLAILVVAFAGAAHAEGPVSPPKGELNPWPVAMERARRPISQPN